VNDVVTASPPPRQGDYRYVNRDELSRLGRSSDDDNRDSMSVTGGGKKASAAGLEEWRKIFSPSERQVAVLIFLSQ